MLCEYVKDIHGAYVQDIKPVQTGPNEPVQVSSFEPVQTGQNVVTNDVTTRVESDKYNKNLKRKAELARLARKRKQAEMDAMKKQIDTLYDELHAAREKIRRLESLKESELDHHDQLQHLKEQLSEAVNVIDTILDISK
jgi:multidrug resistance efflux pump